MSCERRVEADRTEERIVEKVPSSEYSRVSTLAEPRCSNGEIDVVIEERLGESESSLRYEAERDEVGFREGIVAESMIF